MTWIDYIVFLIYMVGLIGIGIYFFLRNRNIDDFYVGGRKLSAGHIGLSIVATDVGGGFSIGLGGLGYLMGLSGSWLLFTGLLGAWLVAVLIIPKIKKLDSKHQFLTFPQFLKFRYGKETAAVAGVISGLGYLGFTGAQILAGAKLMTGTIIADTVLGLSPMLFSTILIGLIIIVYTALGGLKAVIYTDTIQWIILLMGLIFLAIPFGLDAVGGWSAMKAALPDSHFDILAIKATTIFNWMITIIPIWFVGMTLYQRIYAAKDERTARRAWFLAGLFEYPIMAFTGVLLGMISRVLFAGIDAEMGVPMLIRDILPAGITGIVIASYFSAIMSTADSCLMASSGNFLTDLIQPLRKKSLSFASEVRISQILTLILGAIAVLIASNFQMVLDAILWAYSFMVSGLFIPTLGAYFWKESRPEGALAAMIGGGVSTVALSLMKAPFLGDLEPAAVGILISLFLFVTLSLIYKRRGAYESV
ncbi:MAG TPA: sodium:solute symporter family protein [Candidatus Marinimicrobia bacterium]|nr:sodium:solute symporter family protein [Candidatus Neomarinimicrobiota bacterium]